MWGLSGCIRHHGALKTEYHLVCDKCVCWPLPRKQADVHEVLCKHRINRHTPGQRGEDRNADGFKEWDYTWTILLKSSLLLNIIGLWIWLCRGGAWWPMQAWEPEFKSPTSVWNLDVMVLVTPALIGQRQEGHWGSQPHQTGEQQVKCEAIPPKVMWRVIENTRCWTLTSICSCRNESTHGQTYTSHVHMLTCVPCAYITIFIF